MKAIILSPYMANVNPLVREYQFKVMNAICAEYTFKQVLTDKPHGKTCDMLLNTCIKKGYDVALIMDIDAIPLSNYAIEHTLYQANKGKLVGNVQRSNHIKNDQHVFVAPSFIGINLQSWDILGRPSFVETERGDVGEEFTYAWEERGWPMIMYMPKHYEQSPKECESWALKDGMPHYGIGTTFEHIGTEMSYHAFQIIHNKSLENFINKCNSIINAPQKAN
jgi:hypothetical protein